MTAGESYRCSTRRMSRIRGSRRVVCKVHMIYVQLGADGLVRDHVLRVEARCRSGGVGPLCILGWLAEGLKTMAARTPYRIGARGGVESIGVRQPRYVAWSSRGYFSPYRPLIWCG